MAPTSRLCLPLTSDVAESIASMTQAIGTPTWFDAALNLLCTVCSVDSGGAMLYHRHAPPQPIVHRFNPKERTLPGDAYFAGPYALDPHYQLFLQNCPSGARWLRDLAPDEFFQSEFHRVFYSQIGLSDSIELLWRINADTALNLFVERSIKSTPFDSTDLLAIQTVLPILFASASKHHALAHMTMQQDSENLTHLKVQSTIDNFASSLLTKRERQVLFYMISGYSSALTAQKLKATEGTIKIHRKNIHRKLDIGSQAELFSLFINCIPFAKPHDGVDPLQTYQSMPAKRKSTGLLAS